MSVKAPNATRARPTVSFALSESQIERLREIAWSRDVSLSQVAREALDLALERWERDDALPACAPQSPTRWPRALRRAAARGDER
jgi:hypothetical protein